MIKIINWLNENEGFVSAILTTVTVCVAIIVPTCIAIKQNKIVLYEKRFECYKQLKALKAYWLFLNDIATFSTSVENGTNLIWNCQQRYFDAHNLLDDKDFQRNRFNHSHQISYARACIEGDNKMLLSLKLLVCEDDNEGGIAQTRMALEAFIYELFNYATEENKNSETDERLLHKKNDFVARFEETLKLENKLEKLLKIAIKKPKKMSKGKEK